MSNTYNNVLYFGVTNDLVRRIAEHKAKVNKGFTYKYNVDKLVYFESIHSINDAIAREKQIKNWKREWKNELVNKENPDWKDLSDSIGVTDEVIEAVKVYYKGIAGQARNDACNDEAKTLSPVEQAYWDTIKALQKKIEKKGGEQ